MKKICVWVAIEKNKTQFKDPLRDFCVTMEMNTNANKIEVYEDENFEKKISSFSKKNYELLRNGFPAIFYVSKKNVRLRIELDISGHFDFYPSVPFCMRKGFGAEEESLDLAVYIELVVALCEQMPIYELKTKIIDSFVT